jgi:putative membrane protein
VLAPPPVEKSDGLLSDGQVVGILETIHDVQIEQGRLARANAADVSVKSFAELMINEHTAAADQLHTLTQRIGVTSLSSDPRQTLVADAGTKLKDLRQLTGVEFETAYVEAEVELLGRAIMLYDQVLATNARNTELLELLKGLWPKLVAHLQHARMLQHREPMARR